VKDGDGVELRASIEIIDEVIEKTLYIVEENLNHDYKELYHLEEIIPRELGAFIELLRTLPTIEEERELPYLTDHLGAIPIEEPEPEEGETGIS